MSTSIDERIVQMTFNNKDFEKNANQTISTLEKLKSSLNFTKSADNFKELETAANKVNFNSISNSLDDLKGNFTKFGNFLSGFWRKLGEDAETYAKNLVKSLTLEPIRQSWSGFEQMLSSEQTIMSAVSGKINQLTGELYNMEDVTQRIQKLQWYTDETSYKLDQMTTAIGSFTGAGIDLDVATNAIMGISNACADAGVSVQKAESAFQGFSRAIGNNGLTLGVWNNQIKTSGLTNSEKFRKSLIETAESMGYLTKVADNMWRTTNKGGGESGLEVSVSNLEQSFNKGKWANAEVMLKTLNQYSDTVDTLYSMVSSGRIDLTVEGMESLRKAMQAQGKTMSSLGLKSEYDTASQAIADLTAAYQKLGVEVPQSLASFTRAQEAVSFTQAVDATREAVTSKWSQTFELIFGNYEEGKALWTKLANESWEWFASGGEARNELLKQWHEGMSDFLLDDGLLEDERKSLKILEDYDKKIEEAYNNSFLHSIISGEEFSKNFYSTLLSGSAEEIGKAVIGSNKQYEGLDHFSEEELATVNSLYDAYQRVLESKEDDETKTQHLLEIEKEIGNTIMRFPTYEELGYSNLFKNLKDNSDLSKRTKMLSEYENVLSSSDQEKIYDYLKKNYKQLESYGVLSNEVKDSWAQIAKITNSSSSLWENGYFGKQRDLDSSISELVNNALKSTNYEEINALEEKKKVLEEFYDVVNNKDSEKTLRILDENFNLISYEIGGFPDKIENVKKKMRELTNDDPLEKLIQENELLQETGFSQKDVDTATKYLDVFNSLKESLKVSDDNNIISILKNKDSKDAILQLGRQTHYANELQAVYEEIDKINKDTTITQQQKNFLLEVQYTKLRDFLYEVSSFDTIGELQTELNDSLSDYLTGGMSGFTIFADTLGKIMENITAIITAVREAFSNVFPPKTAVDLINITQGFADFVDEITPTESFLERLTKVFEGLFSVLDLVKNVAITIYQNAIKLVIPYITSLTKSLFGLVEDISSLFIEIDDGVKKSEGLKTIFSGIGSVLITLISNVTKLVEWIRTLFKSTSEGESSAFSKFFSTIGDIFETIVSGISNAIKNIGPVLEYLGDILKKGWDKLKEIFASIKGGISNFVKDNSGTAADIAETGFFGYLLIKLPKLFKNIKDVFSKLDILSTIKKTFDGLADALKKLMETKIKTEYIKSIGESVLMIAGALLVLSFISPDKLITGLGAIAVTLAGVFKLLTKISTTQIDKKNLATVSGAIVALSLSLIMMSAALKILSSIDFGQMMVALLGFGSILAGIFLFIKGLSGISKEFNEGTIKAVGKSLTGIGIGMIALAAALKIMSSMSIDEMNVALTAFFSTLIGIFGLISLIEVVSKNDENAAKKIKAIGSSMVGLGIGLIAVGAALKIMASMNIAEMGVALLGLIGSLGAIFGFMVGISKLSSASDFSKVSASMLLMSTSLVIIGAALKIVASMDWQDSIQSVLTMSGALLAIGVFMAAMAEVFGGKNGGPGTIDFIAISGGLAIVSAAMLILAGALKVLGSLTDDQMRTGLLTLAASLILLGTTAAVLSPLAAPILALSAAFAIFGAGLVLVASGLTKLIPLLVTFNLVGANFADALVNVMTQVMTAFVSLLPSLLIGIVNAIISVGEQIAKQIVQIIGIISNILIPGVVLLIQSVVLAIKDVVVTAVPAIVEMGTVIINSLIDGCRQVIPNFIQLIFDILAALEKGITDNMSIIISGAFNILITFINGLADFLSSDGAMQLGEALGKIITALLKGIKNVLGGLGSGIWNGIKSIFTDDDESSKANTVASEQGGNLMDNVGEGIKSKLGSLTKTGKTVLEDTAEDMKTPEVTNAFNLDGIFAVEGIESGLLSDESKQKMLSAGAQLFDWVKEGTETEGKINSPSKEMAKDGKYIVLGLIKGIENNAPKLIGVGETIFNALSKAIETAESTLSDSLNPVITPVLDLSEIQNGTSKLSGLLNTSDISAKVNSLGNSFFGNNNTLAGAGEINISLNNNFDIQNGQNIDRSTVSSWSNWIFEDLNEQLGQMIR